MMHSIKPFLCLGFPKTTRLSPAISPLVWSDVYFCTRQKELDTRFDFMFLSIKSFINYIPNQTPSPSIIFNFIFYHSHITFSQLQHVKKAPHYEASSIVQNLYDITEKVLSVLRCLVDMYRLEDLRQNTSALRHRYIPNYIQSSPTW